MMCFEGVLLAVHIPAMSGRNCRKVSTMCAFDLMAAHASLLLRHHAPRTGCTHTPWARMEVCPCVTSVSHPTHARTHARMHARTHTKAALTGRCYLVQPRCGGRGACPGRLYLARFCPDSRRFVRLPKGVSERLGIHTISDDFARGLVRLSLTSVPSMPSMLPSRTSMVVDAADGVDSTDAHPAVWCAHPAVAGCVCGGQFTADVCERKLQLRAIEQSWALAVA